MKPLFSELGRAGPLALVWALWPTSGWAQPPVTNWGGPLPPVPDVGQSLFRVFGALGLVLLLFFGGVWLFRNWQQVLVRRGRPARLRVLESRSLGSRHALFVVGYDRQRLLVASSPTGVTLLSPLPAAETDEPVPTALAPFATTLQELLGRK